MKVVTQFASSTLHGVRANILCERRYILVVQGLFSALFNATPRYYLAFPLPCAKHLVKASLRVSRWHAPPKFRGLSCSPLSPLGCERKRKRKDEKRRSRALPKTEMKRASGEEQCAVDDGCQNRRRRGYARFLAWLRRQNKNRVKIKAVASRRK